MSEEYIVGVEFGVFDSKLLDSMKMFSEQFNFLNKDLLKMNEMLELTSKLGMSSFDGMSKGIGIATDKAAMLTKELAEVKKLSESVRFNGGDLGAAGGVGHAVGSSMGKMFDGALVAGAGYEMLKSPIDSAREYQREFTKFQNFNFSDKVNAEADKFAKSSQLYGVSAKDLMTTLSESVGIFGSVEMAEKVSPFLAQLDMANSAIYHGKVGHIDEAATKALKKFADRRGAGHDFEKFKTVTNLAEKIVTGSGGFIKFQDLGNFSQFGGTAFRSLSDTGLLEMSGLIGEMGGAKAGNAMMSGYQNLVAGRTTMKAMHELSTYGLAKLSEQTIGHLGNKEIKSMKMDLVDKDLFQAAPVEWFQKVLIPKMDALKLSENQRLTLVNDLFSNRTASSQASLESTQQLQIMRDYNLAKNAKDGDQVIEAWKKTPDGKFGDLGARWEDAKMNLGNVAMPLVISGVEHLTSLLKDFSAAVNDHPILFKDLTTGFIALSGALLFSGSLMLLAGGFGILKTVFFSFPMAILTKFPMIISGIGLAFRTLSGMLFANPIGLAILGIAAAAYLVWNNWKEISASLKIMWNDLKIGFTDLFHGEFMGAFQAFKGYFLMGWQMLFNTMIAGINHLLPAAHQISKFTFANDAQPSDAAGGASGSWGGVSTPAQRNIGNTTIEIPFYLDGRKLAHHTAKILSNPNSAQNGFSGTDFGMHLQTLTSGGR